MTTPIFHITHVDNLPSILTAQCLWSDSQRLAQQFDCKLIGYSHIKARRLRRPVANTEENAVAAGGFLGDYVPFNFCPRSVMLYAIHKKTADLDYKDGQEQVIHLVSSVEKVVESKRAWAFTDIHADLRYAGYFDNWAHKDEVKWDVMPLTYWSEETIKKQRQAEFLVHERFPWTCVERIGVINEKMAERVKQILLANDHRPAVEVQPKWYY